MNEYYLHDRENGQPQQAAQIWRDAHTVDQLASKIRAHISQMNGNKAPHFIWYNEPLVLAIQEYTP